jgi:hypothetical protein
MFLSIFWRKNGKSINFNPITAIAPQETYLHALYGRFIWFGMFNEISWQDKFPDTKFREISWFEISSTTESIYYIEGTNVSFKIFSGKLLDVAPKSRLADGVVTDYSRWSGCDFVDYKI